MVKNPSALQETWVQSLHFTYILVNQNHKVYSISIISYPGGGHGSPLQYSCLENLHGQRSLMDYSPRGHKESDTTKP